MYWALLCPFLLRSIAALVINELENWNIPVVKELIDNPERDFLDVDVNSDFLDTSVSIKTVYEPLPVCSAGKCVFFANTV